MTLPRLIVGIDPSSKKLAFCSTEFPGKSVPVLTKISLPVSVLRASGAAYREAFLFFQRNPDSAVYMESPLVGRSAYSTIVQAQVGGAVIAAADNAGVEFNLVNVNSWKKQVTGKGNSDKSQVAEWLRDNWPEAYTRCEGDQDLMDASAINRYGFRYERIRRIILRKLERATQDKEVEGSGSSQRVRT